MSNEAYEEAIAAQRSNLSKIESLLDSTGEDATRSAASGDMLLLGGEPMRLRLGFMQMELELPWHTRLWLRMTGRSFFS